jgi:hypothetical protein
MPNNYGPSAGVIRARRITVLLVLIGLVWGLIAGVLGVVSWVGGIFNPGQTPTLVAGAQCQPQQVKIEAHVGTSDKTIQNAFNPGDTPYFWFTVTNTGTVDCKFNVGSSVTYYSVKSGSDNIWTSKDCKLSSARTDLETVLTPSTPISSQPDYWERTRSSTSGGCTLADGQPDVSANGASYVLTAEVNGNISDGQQFVLN